MQLQPNIFVLYALEDEKYFNVLKQQCRSLIEQEKIKINDYRNITPGENKQKEINQIIKKSDIIIPLLSGDFFDLYFEEDYSYWKLIWSEYRNNNLSVIPIYLRYYAYEAIEEMKDLDILLNPKTPLINENGYSEANFHLIANKLSKIAEKIQREKKKKYYTQQTLHLFPFPFSQALILHFFSQEDWEVLKNQRNILTFTKDKKKETWKPIEAYLENQVIFNNDFLEEIKEKLPNIYKNSEFTSYDLANVLSVLLTFFDEQKNFTLQNTIIDILSKVEFNELKSEKKHTEVLLDQLLNALPQLKIENTFDKAKVHQKLAKAFAKTNYKWNTSLELAEKALKVYQDTCTPEEADIWNLMGHIYGTLQEFLLSKEHFERALSIKKKVLESTNIELGELYLNLASPCFSASFFQETELYIANALEIFSKQNDIPYRNVNWAYRNLTLLYREIEDYTFAEKISRIVLLSTEENKGKASIEASIARSLIADIYNCQGDFEDAIPHYKKAYEIQKDYFKGENISTIYVLNNLAKSYCSIGKYEKANQHFQTVLNFLEEKEYIAKKAKHLFYKEIGKYYLATKNYEEAKSFFLRNLVLSSLENMDLEPFNYLYGIGVHYQTNNDFPTALLILNAGLELRKINFEENHPSIIQTENKIKEIEQQFEDQKLNIRNSYNAENGINQKERIKKLIKELNRKLL